MRCKGNDFHREGFPNDLCVRDKRSQTKFKPMYIWCMGLILRLDWPEGHRIALWQCTETADELSALLPSHAGDEEEKTKLRHPKRALEWYGSRAALRIGLKTEETVHYLDNGKPFLAGSAMSLSHCLPITGALTHPEFAGMDIQASDPKLEKIKEKFAHPKELDFALKSADSLDALTILWSAKEALFKVYGQEKAFADQLRIDPFTPGQSQLSALVEVSKGEWVPHGLRCFRVLEHWVVVAHTIGQTTRNS